MTQLALPNAVETGFTRLVPPMEGARLYATAQSPIGELLFTADGHALTGLYLETEKGEGLLNGSQRDDGWFSAAKAQLAAYFAGELTQFDLLVAPHGTAFQWRVWQALLSIPYGTTTSYGRIASQLGEAKAARAVGLANGRNPISIIIPCHRVIGASGALTGYGGGLDRKAWLLAHEARQRPSTVRQSFLS